MRISDWSSDVCSSDLTAWAPATLALTWGFVLVRRLSRPPTEALSHPLRLLMYMARQLTLLDTPPSWRLDEHTREVGRRGVAEARASPRGAIRWEERRGGREGISTGRSQWSRTPEK